MKIPNLVETKEMLAQAEELNPGPWVAHTIFVGEAASAIAAHHPDIDADAAHILGMLHDIGRREGSWGARHIIDGYKYLLNLGFEDAAKISLTHPYPIKNIHSMMGNMDFTKEEIVFVTKFLAEAKYSNYDRLIQLCDALALSTGFCLIEKRMVEAALRLGTNKHTVAKWKAIFDIKHNFEQVIGRSIYSVLPAVVENTFEFAAEE